MLSTLLAVMKTTGVLLEMVSDAKKRKFIKEWTELKLELNDELEKGYYSNDAKVEHLLRKITILSEAIQHDPTSGPS